MKKLIKQFVFHEYYLGIDWTVLKSAFDISIHDGSAKIFFDSPDLSKYEYGMWFAFLPQDITEFSYQKESDQEMGEIWIVVKDKKKSLGITKDDDIAQRWVNMANQVLQEIKSHQDNT